MTNTPGGARKPVSSATPLTAEVTERDDVVIVSLTGEVDAITVDRAAAAVDDALDRTAGDGRGVILDLTGITFFASVGLNLLVRLRQEVADRQVDVRLAVSTSAVLRPLQLMGLGELFPTFPTLHDALGAPTGQG